MSSRQHFESLIEADPYDMNVRKVFTDWLYEFGNGSTDDELANHHANWTVEKQAAYEKISEVAQEAGFNYDNFVNILLDKLKRTAFEDIEIEVGFNFPNDVSGEATKEFWDNFELLTNVSAERNKSIIFHCC